MICDDRIEVLKYVCIGKKVDIKFLTGICKVDKLEDITKEQSDYLLKLLGTLKYEKRI